MGWFEAAGFDMGLLPKLTVGGLCLCCLHDAGEQGHSVDCQYAMSKLLVGKKVPLEDPVPEILDGARIERLLMELQKAHGRVIYSAGEYEKARVALSESETFLLVNHVFEGKNAEARKLEAEVLVADSSSVFIKRNAVEKATRQLSVDKAALEIAREAISLWRALAYQMQPERA